MAADVDERADAGAHARTLALSDGVFAIAMTLLVLSIHLPDLAAGHETHLGSALWDHHEELFSWLLSFVVLGLQWVRHRAIFAAVPHVDAGMTRLNLVFLATVAFLPYPTQVLGIYGGRPAAVGLYACTLALLSVSASLMARRALGARGYWWLVPAIILLAVPLSFVVGSYAMLVFLAIPLTRRLPTPDR